MADNLPASPAPDRIKFARPSQVPDPLRDVNDTVSDVNDTTRMENSMI